MDVDAKLAGIHAVAGIIVGYLSFILKSVTPTNYEAFAVLLAIIILIVVGNISERIFGKEAVGGTKGWLWSGILPYFFVWIIVWTILLNMNPV